MPDYTIEELITHPLAIYTKVSVEARKTVEAELSRLKLRGENRRLTYEQRDEAQIDYLALNAELNRMDEADQAFMARIMIVPFGPTEEVVQRTIELNDALGKEVAANLRAKAFIGLLGQWIDGLTAVVEGKVASMPPAALAAPTKQGST